MQNIAFEQMFLAIEAVRGTLESAPTVALPFQGILKPQNAVHEPANHGFGTLANHYQSITTRRWSEVDANGALDTAVFPFILAGLFDGSITSPSTPAGGVLSQLWTFPRNIESDNISTYSTWWGDANIQTLASAFTHWKECVVTANANNDDATQVTISGIAHPATKETSPTPPTDILGSLLTGTWIDAWLDVAGSPIGTTPLDGRLVSAQHTIQTGATQKYLASGAGSERTFVTIGRSRMVGLETQVVLEIPDFSDYDLWDEGTIVKLRVRHNGAFIEDSTIDPFDPIYEFVEFDVIGQFKDFDWQTNVDSNRTIQLTLSGKFDGELSSDAVISVMNTQGDLIPA